MNGTNLLKFHKKHLSDLTSYTFAVIITKYNNDWVMVRHRNRSTWELPAGHVEEGESVVEAANRELFEETGAIDYSLKKISSYQGMHKGRIVYGMLFFANVKEFGPLPESEIAEKKIFSAIPEDLTYPQIQPQLISFYLKD
ncbi:MAG: NUDIX domain-containing protein [Bacteroidales bacterium]|nr:NUDIX domain-containing protein [Bacteroidales bacterium]